MKTLKATVAKIYDNGEGKPAKMVDSEGHEWKFWTKGFQGAPGGIPLDRMTAGNEYNLGFVEKAYNGKIEREIKAVDGEKPQSASTQVKLPPKPAYRQASAPGERRSIEIQSVAQRVPHWFAGVEPGDVEHLAEIINKIAKARDLSALGGTNAQKETDMEGDNIPY
jgi:hypothetical protein